MLQTLASQPPRELDLSFTSLQPCSSTTAAAMGAAEPVATQDVPSASASGAAGAVAAVDAAQAWSHEMLAPLSTSPSPSQLVFELLAAAVLPADAPGVENLNLAGSRGLLLLDPYEPGEKTTGPEQGGGHGELTALAFSETAAFVVLLRDALMSPLCKTTHLLLSGMRGAPLEDAVDTPRGAYAAVGGQRFNVLDPVSAKSLCEAASACLSLRYLDLGGCDLSGPLGAAAASAAVACLIRCNDDNPAGGEYCGHGSSRGISAETGCAFVPGLSRLSLRACRLGAAGLSAVFGALVGAFFWDDGSSASYTGGERKRCNHDNASTAASSVAVAVAGVRGSGSRRRKEQLPRLPHLLDLSDNRPSARRIASSNSPSGYSAVQAGHGVTAGVVGGGEDVDGTALRDIAAAFRTLEQEGVAAFVVSDPTRLSARYGRHGRDVLNNLPKFFSVGHVHCAPPFL